MNRINNPYLHSRAKRALDVSVVTATSPASFALGMGLERYVATHNPHIDGPYYWQERIAGDGSFLMPKFRCLAGDDESNDEFHTHYHSRVASPMFQKFRDIGVDELPQLRSQC